MYHIKQWVTKVDNYINRIVFSLAPKDWLSDVGLSYCEALSEIQLGFNKICAVGELPEDTPETETTEKALENSKPVPEEPQVWDPLQNFPTKSQFWRELLSVPAVPQVQKPLYPVPETPQARGPLPKMPKESQADRSLTQSVSVSPRVRKPLQPVPEEPQVWDPLQNFKTKSQFWSQLQSAPTGTVQKPLRPVPETPEVKKPLWPVPEIPQIEKPLWPVPEEPQFLKPLWSVAETPQVEKPLWPVLETPQVPKPLRRVPETPHARCPLPEIPMEFQASNLSQSVSVTPRVRKPLPPLPEEPEAQDPDQNLPEASQFWNPLYAVPEALQVWKLLQPVPEETRVGNLVQPVPVPPQPRMPLQPSSLSTLNAGESSPDSPGHGTPYKNCSKTEKTAENFNVPIEMALKHLSHEQLVNMIKNVIKNHNELENEIRRDIPKCDLAPYEEKLHYYKSNIYKALPTSVTTSKTDSAAYPKVVTHLAAFEKCLVQQGRSLLETQQWDSLVEYVFLAWDYVRDTPVWDVELYNFTRKQCFTSLIILCLCALTNASFDVETLFNINSKLQEIMSDTEEMKCCLQLVQSQMYKILSN